VTFDERGLIREKGTGKKAPNNEIIIESYYIYFILREQNYIKY
jgi:hypothetical protein